MSPASGADPGRPDPTLDRLRHPPAERAGAALEVDEQRMIRRCQQLLEGHDGRRRRPHLPPVPIQPKGSDCLQVTCLEPGTEQVYVDLNELSPGCFGLSERRQAVSRPVSDRHGFHAGKAYAYYTTLNAGTGRAADPEKATDHSSRKRP